MPTLDVVKTLLGDRQAGPRSPTRKKKLRKKGLESQICKAIDGGRRDCPRTAYDLPRPTSLQVVSSTLRHEGSNEGDILVVLIFHGKKEGCESPQKGI